MKKAFRILSVIWETIAGRLRLPTAYKCGHRGRRRTRIMLWGTDLGPKTDPDKLRCPSCEVSNLEKVCIRCADLECGKPILPGDAICVVIPSVERTIGPWAYRFDESVVLGSCCGNGSDYSGNWRVGRYRPPESATTA